MLTVRAPAKLNLTLEVLAKRPDGFHEIRSVIQAIDLYDSITFQTGDGIEFRSDYAGWKAEESLVSKATSLLQQKTGCVKGVTIEVRKHIPLVSGLGGDSSDAAAVLRGLNKIWELDLSKEELLGLARQLGSDVSFFLYGGTALVEGRGELVTPLTPLPHTWVVLAIPPVPHIPEKTKKLYSSLKANHYTDGQVTRKLIEELEAGSDITPSLLLNTFENVAFSLFSELGIVREHMLKMGATSVHLAGSGPALYTMMKDKNQAEEFYQQLKQQRLEPYLAQTLAVLGDIENVF